MSEIHDIKNILSIISDHQSKMVVNASPGLNQIANHSFSIFLTLEDPADSFYRLYWEIIFGE